MIWFAVILAFILAVVTGLLTRDIEKALVVGLTALIVGVLLSLLIVYSGLMGG